MADALYQYRDNEFSITVYDTDGTTVIPASTYLNAQYRVFPIDSCTPVVSKSLSSGITVVNKTLPSGDVIEIFAIDIEDTEMTFSGTNGEYKHVFVVGEEADEVLPSIFDELVDVIPGCLI